MKKIYDSEETLRAGLKAEQATIIEYTEYLNLAKQNGNESEVRLWEHIIKDEQEHVKEFENALKGDFNLLDSFEEEEIEIREKPEEEIEEEEEREINFHDEINDVLVDAGLPRRPIYIEYPYAYIDYFDDGDLARRAF